MTGSEHSRWQFNALDLVGYLTWGAITAMAIWLHFSNHHPNRWLVTGLLLAFGGLLLAYDLGCCEVHPLAPHLYTGTQTVLIGSLFAMGDNSSLFILLAFILSAQVMMLFPQQVGYLWLLIFVGLTAAWLVIEMGWPDGILVMPIYAGGFFFFAAFANQTSRAEAARQESQRLLEELQIAHRQLQEYAAQVQELTVAEERNRLAREMHDTMGHRLTVASVQLEGAQRLIPNEPERAAGMVSIVREQVREALSELRRTVATLRSPLEADLPLTQALVRLASGFEMATGITVHLQVSEALPDLPPALRLAFYRGAQEGLTNIHKHAHARNAWIQLIQQAGTISLTVQDDGVGLALNGVENGFGLHGLRERTLQLGGELVLEPRPGGGSQLRLELPTRLEAVHG